MRSSPIEKHSGTHSTARVQGFLFHLCVPLQGDSTERDERNTALVEQNSENQAPESSGKARGFVFKGQCQRLCHNRRFHPCQLRRRRPQVPPTFLSASHILIFGFSLSGFVFRIIHVCICVCISYVCTCYITFFLSFFLVGF